MATETKLTSLVLNEVESKAVYDKLKAAGKVAENEIWLVPDETLSVSEGGTGATTAADARTNLGVAAASHEHSAADINSGTIDAARLPTVNNLTSDSTTAPLSAAQGKELKKLVDENAHPLDQITTGTAASMDDYTQAGLYWLDPNVTNTPNDGYGLLIVIADGVARVTYQTFITYYTNNGYVATRCYTNSQWYAWDERPMVTPITHGGTGATTAAAARTNLGAAKSDYEKWSIYNGATRRYDTEVSKDLLSISTNGGSVATSAHQPATIMTEDASTLKNSPVTSGGFWARRTVYPVSNPTGSKHITVELEEYEPVLGRRWLRTYYEGSGWSSKWVEISPASPLDQMVSGSSANINDYTGAGLYWMNKTAVTNTPNGGSGMLIVTTSPTGNVIYQTFVSFNTSSGYVATRCYINSRWYNWDERPAPASYVTQEGTSGAWRYRIWSDGKKECWLRTGLTAEIPYVTGNLYASGIITYSYPITFTENPTLYVGVRSYYVQPIWGIPAAPATGLDPLKHAYLELLTVSNTKSFSSDVYIYAAGI